MSDPFMCYFLPFAIGSIVGIIVAFLIVQNAKLKQTEFQLLKERKRLEEYVELANVMFVVLDLHGNVIFINKRGCEILGCSKDEILGKNWIESFVPERIKDEIEDLFCSCEDMISDLIGYHENPILTRDGQEKIIAWHNKVIFDNHGNIKRVLSAGQD